MKKISLWVIAYLLLAMPINAQVNKAIQAIQAMPNMPTAENLSTAPQIEAYENNTYEPYEQVVSSAIPGFVQEAQSVQQAMIASHQKQSTVHAKNNAPAAGGMGALMPTPEEMMGAIMSSGINPEKATEAQIMDVVAGVAAPKWGVSKEEYIKIINMAQKNPKQAENYVKANQPALFAKLYSAAGKGMPQTTGDDADNEKLGQLGTQLNALQNDFQQPAQKANDFQREINDDKKAKEYQAQWETSAEGQQYQAMESALEKRVIEYEKTLQAGDVVPYPAWMVADLKKMNNLAIQWNKRMGAKWLEVPTDEWNTIKALMERLINIHQQNEQLGGGTQNIIYLMNKQLIISMFSYISCTLPPYKTALKFPAIELVEEEGKIYMDKR